MRSERVLIVGAVVIGVVGAGIVAARRRVEREDVGIALLDLWGALGDLLSAYQEQMAEEAYLGSEAMRRAHFWVGPDDPAAGREVAVAGHDRLTVPFGPSRRRKGEPNGVHLQA